jgi:hypothetical protein
MNVQQAIEAPKWLTRAFPASPFPHTMYPGDLSVEARVAGISAPELVSRGRSQASSYRALVQRFTRGYCD